MDETKVNKLSNGELPSPQSVQKKEDPDELFYNLLFLFSIMTIPIIAEINKDFISFLLFSYIYIIVLYPIHIPDGIDIFNH